MTKTIHGTIHGTTITLSEDPGFPDGETVDVVLRPSHGQGNWGDGILRVAGAAAEVVELDEIFRQIEQERKSARFREDRP